MSGVHCCDFSGIAETPVVDLTQQRSPVAVEKADDGVRMEREREGKPGAVGGSTRQIPKNYCNRKTQDVTVI